MRLEAALPLRFATLPCSEDLERSVSEHPKLILEGDEELDCFDA